MSEAEVVADRDFDPHYMRMLVKVLMYTAPDGSHPQGLPGGKNAIHSPESDSTNLGNNNLCEGVWFQTIAQDGKYMAIFVPNHNMIKGKTSGLWTDLIIQEPDGTRANWTPEEVYFALNHGYAPGIA